MKLTAKMFRPADDDVGLLVLVAAVALGIYTLYMNKPSQALFEPDPDYGN